MTITRTKLKKNEIQNDMSVLGQTITVSTIYEGFEISSTLILNTMPEINIAVKDKNGNYISVHRLDKNLTNAQTSTTIHVWPNVEKTMLNFDVNWDSKELKVNGSYCIFYGGIGANDEWQCWEFEEHVLMNW